MGEELEEEKVGGMGGEEREKPCRNASVLHEHRSTSPLSYCPRPSLSLLRRPRPRLS